MLLFYFPLSYWTSDGNGDGLLAVLILRHGLGLRWLDEGEASI